jgi:hypothetical protein
MATKRWWDASGPDERVAARRSSAGPRTPHGGLAGPSAGDSGGGALAARVCLRRLDAHPNLLPDIQGLYATTDLIASQPSMREDACGC